MKLFSVRENFSKSFDFEGDRFNEIITEYEMKAREGQVVTQLVAALRLSKIRMKDNLGIVKVEHDKNFITSDNPITLSKIGGGNVMPFDPGNLISLPLNETHKLTLYTNLDKDQANFIGKIKHEGEMADREILINNFEQYKQSDRFIIGNQNDLSNFENFLKRCEQPIEPSEELNKRFKKIEEIARKLGLK